VGAGVTVATIYLSKGDGLTADAVSLTDPASILVLPDGLEAPAPAKGDTTRNVTLSLYVTGATQDIMWRNYRSLRRKLRQASRAAGPYGVGAKVTLGVQLGTTEMIYFDVLGGELDWEELHPAAGYIIATLDLHCLRFGRGTRRIVDNLLASSLTIASGWTLTGATASADTTEAPHSGLMTADRLVETTANSEHRMLQSVTTVAGVVYGAVYLKRTSDRSTVRVRLQNASSVDIAVVDVNLPTGEGTTVLGNRRVQEVGDGWWRVVLWATNATPTTTLLVNLTSGGTVSYAGSTDAHVGVWGMQVAGTDPGPIFVDKGAQALITQGMDATTYFAGIPGDVPGFARVYAQDASASSLYLQHLRIAIRGADDLDVTDFAPFVELLATGAGATATDGGLDYTGGSFVTVAPPGNATAFAVATKPAGQWNSGLFHVYARLRDSNSKPAAPENVSLATMTRWTTRRQDAQAHGTGTGFTVALASLPRVGGLMLLAIGLENRTAVLTVPGFTEQVGIAHASAQVQTRIFQRRVVEGDSGSVTVSITASCDYHAYLCEPLGIGYSGNATAVGSNAPSATTTPTVGLTPTATRGFVLMAGTDTNGGTHNWTSSPNPSSAGWVAELSDVPSFGAAMVSPQTTAAHTFQDSLAGGGSPNSALVAVFYPSQSSSAGLALGGGTYDIRVSALDVLGNEGAASAPVSLTLTGGSSKGIFVAWANGNNVYRYRVYFRNGAGVAWEYFDTGAATGTVEFFAIANLTGTLGDPLDTPNSVMADVRASVGMAGAVHRYDGPWAQVPSGGSIWQTAYLGTFALPPVLAGEDDAASDATWTVTLEAKHDDEAGVLDADHLMLVPADEPVVVVQPPDGVEVSALRDWEIETRRDGRTLARLWSSDGTTDAGRMVVDGDLRLAPGAALVAYHMTVTGDRSSVLHGQARFGWAITPLYEQLTGWEE
jgi:hypothetical protein